jgi:TRAP-type transport system small permease protein
MGGQDAMGDRLHRIERVLYRMTRIMSGIGTITVLFMMLINVTDVCARAFLHLSIRGSHELIEFTLVLVVFLGLPYLQHSKANISVSILTDRFPQKAQTAISVVTTIFSLCMVGIMTWEAFGYFGRMWEAGKETTVLNIPLAPFQFIVAGGLLVLCIVILSQLLNLFSEEV